MQKGLKALGLAAMVLLFGSSAYAKDLFVATTGNDAVTYANNSITTPWATPARAWAEALAGDTVYFRGGTYLVTEMINTRSTGHDGTSAAPITFTCYGEETVVIDGSVPDGAVIMIQRSYHHIDRLTIRGRLTGAGSVIQIGYDNPVSEHVKITNSTIELISAGRYDNTSCIQLYTRIANFAEISNCRLIGTGVVGSNNVGANGVIAFRTQGARIFNNEFTKLDTGIYWKHSNALAPEDSLLVRIYNNVFYDLLRSAVYGNPNYAVIQNNLMINCGSGVTFGDDGGAGDGYIGADYNSIKNNTLFNGGIGFIYESQLPTADPNRGCLHNVIENNLIMGPMHLHPYTTPADASGVPIPNYFYDVKSNFNLYPDRTILFVENRTNYSLAAWQAYNHTDAQSLVGSPVFTGGVSPQTIPGFALATGSPGKNAGSDGRDMGADVTKVGIQSPRFTITSPNGGEAWQRGESRPITWTNSGVTGNVVIELVQNSVAVGVIAESVAATAGSFAWTVGRLANGTVTTGAGCKIRIRAASGTAGPTTPVINTFTATPPTITAGNSTTLAWTITGATTNVSIATLGNVTGSNRVVSPTATTTYVLTATNGTSSSTATTTVTVTAESAINIGPPTSTVKLAMIHASIGRGWLGLDYENQYGNFGGRLTENNYYVSDLDRDWDAAANENVFSNRGDSPLEIGTGHSALYRCFADVTPQGNGKTQSQNILESVFTADHAFSMGTAYLRNLPNPGGENTVILFKPTHISSAVKDGNSVPWTNLKDAPPHSDAHTLPNIKALYIDLVNYFKQYPNKMFVLITPPPFGPAESGNPDFSNTVYAANARTLNNWFVHQWLQDLDYADKNVYVLDFYNVITGPNNHHRVIGSPGSYSIQHVVEAGSSNFGYSGYYQNAGDPHPGPGGAAGSPGNKLSQEFVPLLNVYYHKFQAWLASRP